MQVIRIPLTRLCLVPAWLCATPTSTSGTHIGEHYTENPISVETIRSSITRAARWGTALAAEAPPPPSVLGVLLARSYKGAIR